MNINTIITINNKRKTGKKGKTRIIIYYY